MLVTFLVIANFNVVEPLVWPIFTSLTRVTLSFSKLREKVRRNQYDPNYQRGRVFEIIERTLVHDFHHYNEVRCTLTIIR